MKKMKIVAVEMKRDGVLRSSLPHCRKNRRSHRRSLVAEQATSCQNSTLAHL
jgi:hypothetical protein